MDFELPSTGELLELTYSDYVVSHLRKTPGTADLHLYSDLSLGSETVFKLGHAARNYGLGHICVTDRDHPLSKAEAAEFSLMTGVDIIPGLEMSCIHQVHGKAVLLHLALLWPPESPEFLSLLRQSQAGDFPELSQVMQVVRELDLRLKTRVFTALYAPLSYDLDAKEWETLLRDFKALGGSGMEVFSPDYDASQTLELLDLCKAYSLLPTGGSARHSPRDEFYPMKEDIFRAIDDYHQRDDYLPLSLGQDEDGTWRVEVTPELAQCLRRCACCVPGYWSKKKRWGLLYLAKEEYEQWMKNVMLEIENSSAKHAQHILQQVLHTPELEGNTLLIPASAARFAKLEDGTGRLFQPFPSPALFILGEEKIAEEEE